MITRLSALSFLFLQIFELIYACNNPSIGIFVHGCNVNAKNWDYIVWGDEKRNLSGRITKAVEIVNVLTSLEYNPMVSIMWGSGVDTFTSLKEGRFTLNTLLSNFERLKQHPSFHSLSQARMIELKKIISEISITDDYSCNTVTELESCFKEFKARDVKIIVLISSSTHAPRCLKEASNLLEKYRKLSDDNTNWNPILCVCPSDTCYYGYNPRDVVIIEPPHLPKNMPESIDSPLRLHKLVNRCLNIRDVDKYSFLNKFNEILADFDV